MNSKIGNTKYGNSPVNEENSKKLDELFKKLTNNEPAGPMVLQVWFLIQKKFITKLGNG